MIHVFDNELDAIAHRRRNGTGGWIFAVLPDEEKATDETRRFALLFPYKTPIGKVLTHPLVLGRGGKLL